MLFVYQRQKMIQMGGFSYCSWIKRRYQKVKNQIWELDNNKNIKINEEELELISLKINSFYC
jgi:hypothetical protein